MKLPHFLIGIALLMNSLYPTDLSFWQQIPKAELHLHLGGAYPQDYLDSIASAEQQQKLAAILDQISKRVDYHDAFLFFQLISQIVNTEEKVQQGVEALCRELKRDGVVYVEIRSGLKNLGKGTEAYLKAILQGMESERSDHFEAKLLLSLQRNSPLASVRNTLDLAYQYRNLGAVGIDISGDSTLGEIAPILPELIEAKNNGLVFVIHIGESPKETDQMQLLTLLNPVRIGHGVHLSPKAIEWIVSHQTPLEICLTSSVLVKMIETHEQHPGIELMKQGHPVAFCTDDPLLFSTSLSQELLLAQQKSGLTQDEVEKIARDSLKYKIHQLRGLGL